MTEALGEFLVCFEKQFNATFPLVNEDKIKNKKISSVVVFGMGGSGIVGDFIKNTLHFLNFHFPLEVVKNNKLNSEGFYSKETLFLGISFSGNTNETNSILKELIKKGFKNQIALVTSGGSMEKIGRKNKIFLVKIPNLNLTPREGIGLMYNASLKVLKNFFQIKIPQVKIKNKKRMIKIGEEIASKIEGNIVIYTPFELKHLGLLWKNNFNETSKNYCFLNTYPEINHNEVEGFKNMSGKFSFLFLGKSSFPYQKKLNFVKNTLQKNKIRTYFIEIEGKNLWEKTWNGAFLSYIASYYLALKNKENPTETKVISKLKSIK